MCADGGKEHVVALLLTTAKTIGVSNPLPRIIIHHIPPTATQRTTTGDTARTGVLSLLLVGWNMWMSIPPGVCDGMPDVVKLCGVWPLSMETVTLRTLLSPVGI